MLTIQQLKSSQRNLYLWIAKWYDSPYLTYSIRVRHRLPGYNFIWLKMVVCINSIVFSGLCFYIFMTWAVFCRLTLALHSKIKVTCVLIVTVTLANSNFELQFE